MSVTIKLRRGTTAQWSSANPILALGEVGIDTDLKQLKVGDGATAWSSLAYATAPINSPAFTGTPTAPTANSGTNTTQIATTAYVRGEISSLVASAPAALDTLNELATALGNDENFSTTVTNSLALKAPLASPTFTGIPAAPTAAVDTNTTQIATTAFVVGQAGSATPIVNGTAAVGTSLRYARQDHVHGTDTSRAALASPTFTGTPAAPTASADTNTTQLATTAFVVGQASSTTPAALGSAAVGTSLRYARADHVHATPTLESVNVPTVTRNAQTASYTLVLADAGKLVEISNASAVTLTIPADASVNFPIGTKIDVLQTGAGQITIAGSGFTPNATPGLKINAQWGAATLVKRAANTWVVIGNLSA